MNSEIYYLPFPLQQIVFDREGVNLLTMLVFNSSNVHSVLQPFEPNRMKDTRELSGNNKAGVISN